MSLLVLVAFLMNTPHTVSSFSRLPSILPAEPEPPVRWVGQNLTGSNENTFHWNNFDSFSIHPFTHFPSQCHIKLSMEVPICALGWSIKQLMSSSDQCQFASQFVDPSSATLGEPVPWAGLCVHGSLRKAEPVGVQGRQCELHSVRLRVLYEGASERVTLRTSLRESCFWLVSTHLNQCGLALVEEEWYALSSCSFWERHFSLLMKQT